MHDRVGLGVSIFVTTRCNHQCGHCIMSCGPESGNDMSSLLFEKIVSKCKEVDLLKYVVLAGGEPFLDTAGLLKKIRFLLHGHGVLRMLVPTNGKWVLDDDHAEVAYQLSMLGKLIPFGLYVRLSENEWNMEQFGDLREELMSRWEALEKVHPSIFSRKVLQETKVIRVGRAVGFCGETQVPVHCSFDEWQDGELGVYTDYLSFWPDGSCRVCQSGGGILGTYLDDYRDLLEKRARFLMFLRKTQARNGTGLSAKVCQRCEELMIEWADGNS